MNPLRRFATSALVALMLTSLGLPHAHAVTIDMVTVGDPGNANDWTGFGAVADVFAIGKYEVTIGQYTAFLNSVASVTSDSSIVNLWSATMTTNLKIAGISRSGSGTSGDPYSYAVIGSGNRPITHVSWFGAARFANWMHNGATSDASTETGAYTLNGATSGVDFTKNAGATWWIPSENEWYKAAYDKGGGTNAGYWLFPFQSDGSWGNSIGGEPGQANDYDGDYAVTQLPTSSQSQNYLTDVGAFSNTVGAYGTFDQGGNVWEWNDTVSDSVRGMRGGAWYDQYYVLASDNRYSGNVGLGPTFKRQGVGFRLAAVPAAVPEPSTYAMALAGLACSGYSMWRRRKLSLPPSLIQPGC